MRMEFWTQKQPKSTANDKDTSALKTIRCEQSLWHHRTEHNFFWTVLIAAMQQLYLRWTSIDTLNLFLKSLCRYKKEGKDCLAQRAPGIPCDQRHASEHDFYICTTDLKESFWQLASLASLSWKAMRLAIKQWSSCACLETGACFWCLSRVWAGKRFEKLQDLLEKVRSYRWQGQETSQEELQKGPGALAPESPLVEHLQASRCENSPGLMALQSCRPPSWAVKHSQCYV